MHISAQTAAPDIVVVMAARIRELGDGVTAETLAGEFTSQEIKRYGRDAADLALQQRIRRQA